MRALHLYVKYNIYIYIYMIQRIFIKPNNNNTRYVVGVKCHDVLWAETRKSAT